MPINISRHDFLDYSQGHAQSPSVAFCPQSIWFGFLYKWSRFSSAFERFDGVLLAFRFGNPREVCLSRDLRVAVWWPWDYAGWKTSIIISFLIARSLNCCWFSADEPNPECVLVRSTMIFNRVIYLVPNRDGAGISRKLSRRDHQLLIPRMIHWICCNCIWHHFANEPRVLPRCARRCGMGLESEFIVK